MLGAWFWKGYRPLVGGPNTFGPHNFLTTSLPSDRILSILGRLTAPILVLLFLCLSLTLIYEFLSVETRDSLRIALNGEWNRRPVGEGFAGLWDGRKGYYGAYWGSGSKSGSNVAVTEERWPSFVVDSIGGGFDVTDSDGGCRFQSPFDGLPLDELDVVLAALAGQEGYAQGGFIQASPDEVHPIYQLLYKGERRWKDMLRRRSKTLEEAVEEYKRRYGRNPPRGFDHWWAFVQEKNVLLPDEYDVINETLAPFWGFSLKERRKRQREAEKLPWTFTLVKHADGGISSDYVSGHNQYDEWNQAVYGWRSADQIRTIDIMKHLLPVGYRWTMGIADRAIVTPSWDEKVALIEAARNGKELDVDQPEKMAKEDWEYPQWTEACPQNSPLRQGLVESPTPSFATNIRDSGDVCQHPSIFDQHGLYLEARGPASFPVPHSKLLPVGALCRSAIQGDMVTPMIEFGPWDGSWTGIHEDFYDTSVWESKKPTLFWEGHYTDFDVDRTKGSGRWRHSQRARLHKLGHPTIEHQEPLILADRQTSRPFIMDYSVMALKDAYYDLSTTPNGHGGAAQCERLKEDGTCTEMEDIFGMNQPGHDGDTYRKHMYLMDVDGNGWSARFHKWMASHGLVFKSTIYPEWNHGTLPEWFGFVPIKIDYTDLPSVMAFFEGPPDKPDHSRRKVAKIMAENGRCWAKRTWRIQDVHAYMYRLHLEYARLQNSDDPDFDFVLPVNATSAL